MSSEKFPINFDDIWEKAGYTERKNATRAFLACIANFKLVEGFEYYSFKRIIQGPGKPATTWKMTVGAAKRFLASARTKKVIR